MNGPQTNDAEDFVPPPHLKAFRLLLKENGSGTLSQLNCLVAFGLYMEAECEWISHNPHSLGNPAVARYHAEATLPYRINKVKFEAEQIIFDCRDMFVQSAERTHVAEAIRSATEAVHRSPASFWRGTAEAVMGALLWTALLIVVSIVCHWAGIDVVEVYRRAAGTAP